LPFRFTGHGILNGEQLRRLYSSVSLGVAPSLTNYSLLPQEMAACGCPVIDLDGENTRAVYPKGAVVLAPPTIEGVANQVMKLLDDDQLREAQALRGLAYARSLSWEDAALTVEGALRNWAAAPRRVVDGRTAPVSPRQARS
jgi:glycosyltransferase involved in cell wall biosynthesis